ncbi:MAG: cysteine protease [Herbinix sp.]|nr:cysteine protease [Herbinix sp.]
MKRKKRRTKQAIMFVLGLEIILIVVILVYIQIKPRTVKAVTIEAGTETINVEEFLNGSKEKGSFVTDISSLDLTTPGTYEIQIKVGDKIQTATLTIIDTTPPSGKTVDQRVLKEGQIEAKDFVTDITDSTPVTVSYKVTPDFNAIGIQDVALVLSDTSNNRTELTAKLTVMDVTKTVTIEAGSEMKVTAADFNMDNKYTVTIETDLSTLDISKPIIHEIVITVDGKTTQAYIEVVDTTPPNVTAENMEFWQGDEPEAMAFVKNPAGETGLTASYKNNPDFNLLGEQAVTIVVQDESGNQTEQTVVLTVKKDTEAPLITGVIDKTVYIGETLSYKKGVTVTDNRDKEIGFQVDNSLVNLKKEGSYQVTYTATDKAGNKASTTATINVKESVISLETLAQMSNEILADITTPGMTKEEIAYAIYKYTKNHIAYTGHSDKSDWVAEAYRGITNAVGDCFTYFAVSQSLLNQAGIDNMEVNRVGGTTKHYWSLVNIGDGWYHFDSCPNKDHKKTFMMTDDEVDAYSEARGNNYYTFDTTKYPATPEVNPYN